VDSDWILLDSVWVLDLDMLGEFGVASGWIMRGFWVVSGSGDAGRIHLGFCMKSKRILGGFYLDSAWILDLDMLGGSCHPVAFLGPSWDHTWAILGPSWDWGHPGNILGPSWGHPGAFLKPSWSHLGPYWGSGAAV
jgi:hypothetical protein